MNQKAVPAIAADILGLILFFVMIQPLWGASLQNPTVRGGSILFFLFVLVGLGINRIKRLEPVEGDGGRWIDRLNFTSNPRILILLALSLVIIFVFSQSELNDLWGDTVDLFENTGEVHEGEMTLYITFGPIFIWFMAGALYLISFALPTEKIIQAGSTNYKVTEFVALLFVNLFVGAFALYLGGWVSRTLPSMGLVGTILIVLIMLELMFIPTRLRHSFRNPQIISIITFLLVLLGAAVFLGN